MNKKWKVVITDILDAPPDVEQEALGDDVEIIVLKATATDQLFRSGRWAATPIV